MEKDWGSKTTDFDDKVEFDGDVVDGGGINPVLVIGGIAALALILAILGLVL